MCYIENQSTRRVLSKFFENFLQKFMRTIKGWKEFLEINLLVNLSTMLTMCKKERHFGTGNEQFNIFLDFSVNLFVCYVNWAYFYIRSHLNLLWNLWTKLNQIWLEWSLVIPFENYFSLTLHSRWLLLLQIEISLIVYYCFIISQIELKL
jgi:hypothetical protein